MGCACGSKGTVARSSYVASFSDGSPDKVYASEVEAQAAVARRGGGVVRIKK